MDLESVCYEEKLPFLKYLNEKTLLYCITCLAFAGVFSLIWIVKKYTFFEKAKLARVKTPRFPYGNISDVINKETTLYEVLGKYYSRFKKKGYDVGGMFFFIKPVVIIVKNEYVRQILDSIENFSEVYPEQYKLKSDIFDSSCVKVFLENYHVSLKGTILESLKKDDIHSVLRNYLLELVSLSFGVNSFEIIEELNLLLKLKTEANFRYNLSLCHPIFKNKNSALYSDFEGVFLDIMNDRKKNDIVKDDFFQFFINLFNESQCDTKEVSRELFNLFADSVIYSYSVILCSLYEMSRNTDIQDELIGEIRRYNKQGVVLNLDNLKELEYLNSVVFETLRKYPPVPYILKTCQKDFKKNNLVVPKDTLVAVSILGLHRSSENYTDPENFDPDRFADQSDLNKVLYIPFGTRRRGNLTKLVILYTKLTLVDIFSNLTVRKKKDSEQIFKFDPMLIPLRPMETYPFVFDRL
nr:Cytochrome P450 [Sitophilus oryzae]